MKRWHKQVLTYSRRLCKSAFNVCKQKPWRLSRLVWTLLKMSTCSRSSPKLSRGWKQHVSVVYQKSEIRPRPVLIATSSWWEHRRENHRPAHVPAALHSSTFIHLLYTAEMHRLDSRIEHVFYFVSHLHSVFFMLFYAPGHLQEKTVVRKKKRFL